MSAFLRPKMAEGPDQHSDFVLGLLSSISARWQ